MHALAARRTRAYLWDCLGYLGLAVCTVPLGVVINRLGRGGDRRLALAVSALPPVAATVIASVGEAGPHRSTIGKRREQLAVVDRGGQPLSMPRALVRNAVKIGVPWQLGHVVAIGAAFDGFRRRDPLTLGTAVLTYPLLAAMVITGVNTGRALHDRAVDSQVISTRVGASDLDRRT